MVVGDLITQLEGLPKDAWVDAMFPDSSDAFAVVAVEPLTLPDGRVICIIDLEDGVPLKAV